MLRKILSSAIAMAATSSAWAQDSAETTTSRPVITGYADVYYRFNFNNPSKEANTYNNFTSFTNSHNSFELGMVSIKVEHTLGKVGMVADICFGKRAEEFSYNDDKTRLAIKQAYITYAPFSNVKLTAGSWATHVGYELVDPYLNRNYSMSYMFSYGPFFHTGLKADITWGKSSFMLGIANPTDLKSASFTRKHLVAQYGFATADSKLKAYVNYHGGKPADNTKIHQFDLVLSGTLSDKLGIGYNGSIASSKVRVEGKFGESHSWWGSALYFNYDPSDQLGFTLRGEYFDDDPSVSAGAFGAHMVETTLSANIKMGNLTLIPELRLDKASKAIFVQHDNSFTTTATTALLAAVYKF